jgi:hypothetical protein
VNADRVILVARSLVLAQVSMIVIYAVELVAWRLL